MADVIFYEKPGCRTNALQRALLETAGHNVIARNLLDAKWSRDALAAFLGDKAVSAWFNPTAPAIKSGAIDPRTIDADSALGRMMEDPILIRRPLIEALGQKSSGFDGEPVLTLLGKDDINPCVSACLKPDDGASCPPPQAASAVTPS